MRAPHIARDDDSIFEVDGGRGGVMEVGDDDDCVGKEENDGGTLWQWVAWVMMG